MSNFVNVVRTWSSSKRSGPMALTGALAAVALCAMLALPRAAAAVALPPPTADEVNLSGPQTLVLAGGCFWGVQGVFQHVRGVLSAVSGYAGGSKANAHYEIVSTGTTGAAESVKIVYDPKQITLGKLLQIYFSVAHDPTELNRQGPDEGAQYRSAIFPVDPDQAKVARSYIDQLARSHLFARPIVTKIEMSKSFYPAESYHQNFLTRHPDYPYIVINDLPKISDLRKLFPKYYRTAPVLVAESK